MQISMAIKYPNYGIGSWIVCTFLIPSMPASVSRRACNDPSSDNTYQRTYEPPEGSTHLLIYGYMMSITLDSQRCESIWSFHLQLA